MNEIELAAEWIAEEWAAGHGTVSGPRETSLVLYVLSELGEAGLDDVCQRWPAEPLTVAVPS